MISDLLTKGLDLKALNEHVTQIGILTLLMSLVNGSPLHVFGALNVIITTHIFVAAKL